MNLEKTQYDTNLDLSLYIEGLLNVDHASETVGIESKVESILLSDLAIPEVETPLIENNTEEIEVSKIPAWGQESFKCLLVKSAGMKLMIPAMTMSYIERINKKIMRIPLDVAAFRGIVTLRQRSVPVIDLFRLITENSIAKNNQPAKVETQYIDNVIVMEDGSYALACDDIGEMVMLDEESVRWNKASFSNPMFAGVVSEYLCPIINIEFVNELISKMPFVQSLNQKD